MHKASRSVFESTLSLSLFQGGFGGWNLLPTFFKEGNRQIHSQGVPSPRKEDDS